MNNVDILKQWHKSVWEDGDISAICDLMADDGVARAILPAKRLDPVDVETFAALILTMVSNLRGEFILTMAEGDWVSALVRSTATATHSGKEFTITTSLFAKFRDGKITEVYSHFDQFEMFEALGALPEDSLSMCLMGETLS